jgi:hypothetical protein
MTGAFVVKFTRRPISEGINEGINGSVNEGINRLMEFIRRNPGKRVVEIAAALNIPSKTIERWLKNLREQGRVAFIGSRKTGGYFVSGGVPKGFHLQIIVQIKVCQNCFQEFEEETVTMASPVEVLGEIFLETMGGNNPDFQDGCNLCSVCLEELGIINLLGFGS